MTFLGFWRILLEDLYPENFCFLSKKMKKNRYFGKSHKKFIYVAPKMFFFLRLSGKFLQYFFQFFFLHKRQTENLMRPKISKIQGRWPILFLCISKTFCCFFRHNLWKKISPFCFPRYLAKFVQKIVTKIAKFWFEI